MGLLLPYMNKLKTALTKKFWQHFFPLVGRNWLCDSESKFIPCMAAAKSDVQHKTRDCGKYDVWHLEGDGFFSRPRVKTLKVRPTAAVSYAMAKFLDKFFFSFLVICAFISWVSEERIINLPKDYSHQVNEAPIFILILINICFNDVGQNWIIHMIFFQVVACYKITCANTPRWRWQGNIYTHMYIKNEVIPIFAVYSSQRMYLNKDDNIHK